MKKLTFGFIFAALAFTAAAQAETTNCTAIPTLPYTISTQGVYCLTAHLSTNVTSGNAITINTNNVILDLNGFKLGGLGAGLGTQANGIYAFQRQNITIKNGTVRGFLHGIFLDDSTPYTTSQGHVIEDIRADQNTAYGLEIAGNGNIIRNNQVVATGGTTAFGANVNAWGIIVIGPGARVLNNDVTEVAAQGNGNVVGIYMDAAPNSVVAGNRVGNITSPSGPSIGIDLLGGFNIGVKDNILVLSGTQYGIFFGVNATGTYMNNLVRGATTTPYSGGTPAGTTNY